MRNTERIVMIVGLVCATIISIYCAAEITAGRRALADFREIVLVNQELGHSTLKEITANQKLFREWLERHPESKSDNREGHEKGQDRRP